MVTQGVPVLKISDGVQLLIFQIELPTHPLCHIQLSIIMHNQNFNIFVNYIRTEWFYLCMNIINILMTLSHTCAEHCVCCCLMIIITFCNKLIIDNATSPIGN